MRKPVTQRELISDGRGQFDAQALPVGRYFVQGAQGEFKTDEMEAVVTVGRTHTMALALKSANQDTGGKETDGPDPDHGDEYGQPDRHARCLEFVQCLPALDHHGAYSWPRFP